MVSCAVRFLFFHGTSSSSLSCQTEPPVPSAFSVTSQRELSDKLFFGAGLLLDPSRHHLDFFSSLFCSDLTSALWMRSRKSALTLSFSVLGLAAVVLVETGVWGTESALQIELWSEVNFAGNFRGVIFSSSVGLSGFFTISSLVPVESTFEVETTKEELEGMFFADLSFLFNAGEDEKISLPKFLVF